jgi:hypothetical protein
MKIRTLLSVFSVILLVVLLLSDLIGAEGPTPPSPVADAPVADDAEVPDILAVDRASLSPMLQEILAAWDASQVAVAALDQSFRAASDATTALAIQRQIEDLRQQTEVRILGIQAKYARQEGRIEDAEEIEAAIEEMTTPTPRGEPVDRPAPTARNQ